MYHGFLHSRTLWKAGIQKFRKTGKNWIPGQALNDNFQAFIIFKKSLNKVVFDAIQPF